MVTDISEEFGPSDQLPRWAYLPINRCNLPASILGSLGFQRQPSDIFIDGVNALHANLYAQLDGAKTAAERAQCFLNYMTVHFTLEHLDKAGAGSTSKRQKIDYLMLLRGWLFDSEGREAAVLKGWVESRFGLLTRYHRTKIATPDSQNYTNFIAERGAGLFNTNALEAQLDLLYSYCQEEWRHRRDDMTHLTLYRGVNRLEDFDIIHREDANRATLVLNSLNSFSRAPERAGEFGDVIIRCTVPRQKVLYHEGLLPGRLQGEAEYLVIGGAYRVFLIR